MAATLLRSIEQSKIQLVTLAYRLQDRRLKHERLLGNLRSLCRRYGVGVVSSHAAGYPLYTFRQAAGRLRMVRLHRVMGGAGLNDGSVGLFQCDQHEQNGAICLSVSGELDMATVPTFLGALQRAAEAGENIVLDLSALRYMDSSGINALLSAQRRMSVAGRRIVMAAVPPMVARILRLVALSDEVTVFTSVAQAVSSFAVQTSG